MRQPSPVQQLRSSDRPRGTSLAVLKLLWRYLKPYRLQTLGALVALTVSAGGVLALGFALRHLVDAGFATGDAAQLDRTVLILAGLVVILAVGTFARFSLVSWIGERVVADLRRAVYARVIRLSPAFYEVTKSGEVLSRLTTDTTLLQVVVGSSLSQALRNFLMFAGGSVLLVVTSAKLTGLVFVGVPLVLLPIIIFGRRVRILSRDSQDRVAEMGARVDETLTAIRTVQAFTHEGRESERFGAAAESAFTTAVRRIRARAWLTALVILLVFGAVCLMLWVGGHDLVAGRLSGGELSAFVFYAIVVASSVGGLSEVIGDLQRAAGAMERLVELLNTEPEIKAPAQPASLPQPVRGAVALEGVSFRYPAQPQRPTLEELSFQAAPGERLAIVGPSGAGKTTIFQLLLRFYDPQAGRLTLDGLDLRDLEPQALRAQIGLVPQEPVIFSGTALENIRYGRPEASEEAVRAAAEAAQALDFIERLPEGFQTFLGERGVRLSGGQRQRIAIARALLKNPPVLLLDEATSALDAESERAVQTALDRLMAGRTTLVVAHRLATVLKADRILVLDQGRLVEQGTHASLVREGGLYARLAELQFDLAREDAAEAARVAP